MDRQIPVSTGVELCTRVEGEGVPILLIMGIRLQLIHWPPDLCDAIQARGFQVIRFDNRDAGLSTKMSHLGAPSVAQLVPFLPGSPPYTLDDMADDAFALLDALGHEQAHVFGVSMGGMIAQHMALKAPHRVRSMSLLMTTPGGIYLPRPDALFALVRPRTVDSAETYADAFLEVQDVLRGPGSEGFTADERAAMRHASIAAWERAPFPPLAAFHRQLAAVLNAPRRHRALGGLTVPTRIIHGGNDPLVPPRAGVALAHAIDGADLHLIKGMGHGLPVRARARVANLVAEHALRHGGPAA